MKFSSILKKTIMALTGLGLVLFLVTHLLGNLQLPMGAEKFNAYAMMLEAHPEVVIPAELGLIAIFLIHIFIALGLTQQNSAARGPQSYAEKNTAGESTFASRHMWLTGFVILLFVVVHVWQFKFGNRPHTAAFREGSLWDLAVTAFQSPAIVAFYVTSMLIMGFHLSHGFGSLFQSLGLNNSSGHPRLKGLGPIIGWGLAIGFAMLPLWAFVAKPQTGAPLPATVATPDAPKDMSQEPGNRK